MPLPLSACTIHISILPTPDPHPSPSYATSLGAILSPTPHPPTTHVLISRAGTPAHRLALSLHSRPYVVTPAWLAACVRARARVAEDAYAPAPFEGLEVCVSALEVEEKARIQGICAQLGGGYTKSLGPTCTHLICGEPAGRKYEYAMERGGVHVVTAAWVYESERQGGVAEERRFLLPGHEPAVLHWPQVAEAAEKSVLGVSRDAVPAEVAPTSTPSYATKGESRPGEPFSVCHPGQKAVLHWREARPSCVLGAMTFYLTPCGVRDKVRHAPLRAQALQLLALGGGSLSDELSARVNHVVVVLSPVSPATARDLATAQKAGVRVVSLAWVQTCIRRGELAPREDLSPEVWARKGGAEQGGEGGAEDRGIGGVVVSSRVFQGMRCALGPLALFDGGLAGPVAHKVQRGRGKVLPHDACGEVTSGVATHVICGPSLPAGSKQLLDAARARNRHVVEVTPTWVNACLDEGRVVDAGACVLFRPVRHETPLRDMQTGRVSVTVSGFQRGVEGDWDRRRDVLARLARLLGATYSERMRRLRTTHVIAEGVRGGSDKVRKARLWGICVVDYRWLLACARDGCVVNAADYPLVEPLEAARGEMDGETVEGFDEDRGELKVDADADVDVDVAGYADADADVDADVDAGVARVGRVGYGSPRTRRSGVHKGGARRSPRLEAVVEMEQEQGQEQEQEQEEYEEQEEQEEQEEEGGGMEAGGEEDEDDKIELFQRLERRLVAAEEKVAEEMEKSEAEVEVGGSSIAGRRRSMRSRSASRDAQESVYSLDASQSQVIVHRDLTPPPTPRGRRSNPPRAAKRRRNE